MLSIAAILDLEHLDERIFRGRTPDVGPNNTRVFGGQVAAQALIAAGRTVGGDRPVHSLHSYFLRPGDPARPIIYEVDAIRDGGSFTTRRVVAIQRGEAIFNLVITGSLLTIVPLIAAFLLLQRHWQSGLAAGAVKE